MELCSQCGGACFDVNHRLGLWSDDLLPAYRRAYAPNRARIAGKVVVIAGGIALAGGAAYGVVPGELGHNGAQVVNVSEPPAVTPAQVLAQSYLPASAHHTGPGDGEPAGRQGGVGAPLGTGPNAKVVYVDGSTQSDGMSIVSVAFPTADESVLAIRGDDGTCTFLRGTHATTEIANTGVDHPCKADDAPARGWAPFFMSRYGSSG